MELKKIRFKDSAINREERTFSGYASIFGNIDHGNDIVQPGAFKKTIQERGDKIKVMYNHMTLIGKTKHLEETKKGLWVEAYISKTQKGDEVITLIEDKAIDEMSFAYDIIQQEKEEIDGRDIRILKELKLWEISPVDFAMNELAEITTVKSLAERRGIKLNDEQVKLIIKSIQDIGKSPIEALNESVIPLDILSILSRVEDEKNLYMVRSKLNVR